MNEEYQLAEPEINNPAEENTGDSNRFDEQEESEGLSGEQLETAENESKAEIPGDEITADKNEFSERLNAISSKRLDEFIAGNNWVNNFTGEPITSEQEYKEYLAMNKAASQGRDPVTESRISGLERQLNEYKKVEQDNQLLNDTVYGPIYKELRQDCMNIMSIAESSGINTDLNSVFNTVLVKKLPQFMERAKREAAAEATKKINANSSATPGALGASAESQRKSVADMSDKEFNELVEKVTMGEKVILK